MVLTLKSWQNDRHTLHGTDDQSSAKRAWRVVRCQGPVLSIEGWCQKMVSADASLCRGVAESWDRRAPQTPRGGSAPGPQGGPAEGGGVVAAPNPVGPRGPLLSS